MRHGSRAVSIVGLVAIAACAEQPVAPDPSYARRPPPPAPSFDPAIAYGYNGTWRVTDASGTSSADLGLRFATGHARWARGGNGTAGNPYRLAAPDTATYGEMCSRLVIADVDTVGGQPRVAAVRNLELPPLHMACFLDWSPAGDTIVYGAAQDPAVGDGLWLVPVAGGAPVQVYAAADNVFSPDWSPDGSAIAFLEQMPPDGRMALRALNRGTGAVTTIVPAGTGVDRAARWSPDGTGIAFTRMVPKGGGYQAYVYTVAVSRDLNGDYQAAGPPVQRFLGDSPSWSPDGARMVTNGLYIVDVASGTRTKAVQGSWADWR